jgi:hypothetical protein
MTKLDPMIAVRAVAITLLVFNHSEIAPTFFPGGMNVLLLLSGISFATLVIKDSTEKTNPAIFAFIKNLFLIAVVMEIISIAIKQKFDLVEFLMVGNLFHYTRVSIFPIWYVQMLTQILLCVVVAFNIFRLPERIYRAPALTTGLIVLACVAMDIVGKLTWDTNGSGDRVPYLYGWIFTFGWLYWALLINREPTVLSKLALSLATLGGSGLLYWNGVVLGSEIGSRSVYFLAAALTLIWMRPFAAPSWISTAFVIVGQANLSIFLFHITFMRLADLVLVHLGDEFEESTFGAATRIFVGIAGPVALSIIYTAAKRTNSKFKIVSVDRLNLFSLPSRTRGLAARSAGVS